jgi:D-alanyl-D-alanine carboxypeptidase
MDRPPVRHRPELRDRALALVVAIGLLGTVLGPAAAPAEAASLPRCRVADVITRYHAPSDWARSILDTTYRLPRSYRPVGLVPVRRAGLPGSGSIRRVALADLRAMVRAARRAGVRLGVESAYRSYATQVWTFAHWVRIGGRGAALETSARPGHSEHQLGTTIDFRKVGGIRPWLVLDWGRTREGAWLARNGWRYGFVMSYPKGKKSVTCYAYEPWHYRYVGRDLARRVHTSGRTLRQVLWTLQTAPPPAPTATPTPTEAPTLTPTEEPTPTPTEAPTPTA